MNKTELIDAIATKTGVSKADAGKVLDGFFEVASETVGGDDKITLPGFLSICLLYTSPGRHPDPG